MSHPDGGPAFPTPEVWSQELKRVERQDGMSLRDYFAAAAVQGLLASPGQVGEDVRANVSKASAWAYVYANAMLIERKAEQGDAAGG